MFRLMYRDFAMRSLFGFISVFGYLAEMLKVRLPLPVHSGLLKGIHYENTPMQHTPIFHGCKNDNFRLNCFYFFFIFAQNINCGYTLEPPH